MEGLGMQGFEDFDTLVGDSAYSNGHAVNG